MAHQAGPIARPNRQFLAGVVLGVSLGIAAAHLLMVARTRLATGRPTDEEIAFPGDETAAFAAPQMTAPGAGPLPTLQIESDEDVGRVRLSDSSPDGHLHYFPEAMNGLGTSLAGHSAGDAPATSGRLQRTADVSPPSEQTPQAISPPAAAAPIDRATSDREKRARSIIAEELPDATDQERDVWYDVLRGLPDGDIKGILRMRKHIGSKSPALSEPLAAPSLSADAPGVRERLPRASANVSPVAERLQKIAARNKANRGTVAFKRRVALLVEAPPDDQSAVRITGVIRDMSQGDLQPTGRTLDLAIDGPGFLQVRQGDDVRYTRDGRLTLDADGRLKLMAPAGDWLLDPPITMTPRAVDVIVSEAGEVNVITPDQPPASAGTIPIVQFLNPQALKCEGQGLYQQTAAAGTPSTTSPRPTQLVQGHLERSNAADRAEATP